ncbi:MAG: IS66 family transposase [Clostridiales bacterium]|jgi:transposase|nr:IS66 family transposase [Clostridiales bacterium]
MVKGVKKPEKSNTVAISEQEFELFRALKKTFADRLDNVPPEMVNISRQEYAGLLNTQEKCAEVEKQLHWILEKLALQRHEQFGASSEKSAYDFGQLNLFNEVEYFADEAAEEPSTTAVKEYTRKTRLTTDKLPDSLPEEIVHYTLPPEKRFCLDCGTPLHVIGSEEIRVEVKIVPAKVSLVRYIQDSFGYRTAELEGDHPAVVKAPVDDKPVIKGSFASPEALSHVMCQKMVMGSPLYRLEQEFYRMGIPLSRQTMSNWFIRGAMDWLEPIYNRLHEKLLMHTVLHLDETVFQVLHEPGKTPQSNSYLWIYRTGRDAEHPIVLSDYQPSRAAENAKKFLGAFKGYVHCDGYDGYHDLSADITPVGCMSHCRRRFDKALKILKPKEREGSHSLRGKQFCDELFKIEYELDEEKATPDERYKVRQEKAAPILKEFHEWLLSLGELGQSMFCKAAQYALNQWEYLNNYLLDGRLEISNNRCERTVKTFVIDRKNFLFANTVSGAKASAIVFSIVQTAIENGLDPYKYLVHVFRNAPKLKITGNMDDPENRKNIESLLPETMPDDIKAPLKKSTRVARKRKNNTLRRLPQELGSRPALLFFPFFLTALTLTFPVYLLLQKSP